MRQPLFVVFLGCLFSMNSYSQKVSHSLECDELHSSFEKSLDINDFSQSSLTYKKLITNCPSLESEVSEHYISFLKSQISGQKDLELKRTILDSLEAVFQYQELNGHYNDASDIQRATFLLNNPSADKQKINSLISEHLNDPRLLSESLIIQYYANLYALSNDEKLIQQKAHFTGELLVKYNLLLAICSSAGYSDKAVTSLQSYFEATFGNCKKLDNACKLILQKLPKEVTASKEIMYRIMIEFESKNCFASNEYMTLLDSLSKVDRSIQFELKKAHHFQEMQAYSSANSHLESAKNNSKDQREKDSIQLLQGKNLFIIQDYKNAFKLVNTTTAYFQGEFDLLGARCIYTEFKTTNSNLSKDKLVLFYANDLVIKAHKAGIKVDEALKQGILSNLPTSSDLKQMNMQNGQQIRLDNWDITLQIP